MQQVLKLIKGKKTPSNLHSNILASNLMRKYNFLIFVVLEGVVFSMSLMEENGASC